MLVTVNNENKQVNVTIQGETLIVELERGNFVLENYTDADCEFEDEEDYARLLHAALSLVFLGNDIHDFNKWEELFFSGTEVMDEDDLEEVEAYNVAVERDRIDFEREQSAAKAWNAVTDMKAKSILDYLTERWHI